MKDPLNRLIKKEDMMTYAHHIKKILDFKNPQHSQKQDALLKWSAMMEACDILGANRDKILDVGAGGSHLAVCIANEKSQCTLLDNRNHPQFLHDRPRVDLLMGDFWKIANTLPSNHYDLILDACAIHTFDTRSEKFNNDGVYAGAKILKGLVKETGYVVVCGDVGPPKTKGEFLSVEDTIDAYESAGFKMVGESDLLGWEHNDTYSFPYTHEGLLLHLRIARFVFSKTGK